VKCPAAVCGFVNAKNSMGGYTGRRMFVYLIKENRGLQMRSCEISGFLGIYSGRLSDDDNVASIGIVWRKNVISELMERPAAGRRD
jgi:hypothetical protein